MSDLTVTLPPELLEQIAERAAALMAEYQTAPDGWLRGADQIAGYIAAPRSRVYALASCKPTRIPVTRDDSALIAKRSDLDTWLRNGGGKRP